MTDYSLLSGYGQPVMPRLGPQPVSPLSGMPLLDFGQIDPIGNPSNLGSLIPDSNGLFGGFLNRTNDKGITQQGWGGLALGAASGLFNGWLGMKQYGLAKDSLAEGKRQFGLNYDAQKATTNAALEDRQRARLASNSGAYQSLDSYMGQYGIKG